MSIFLTLLELHFSGLKSMLFYSKYQKMLLSGFLCSKEHIGKGRLFEKNHGLTPLQNVDFFDFFRTSLCRSKKQSFLSRVSKNVSFRLFLVKKKTYKKKVEFWQKPWKPLCKMPLFFTLLEFHFSGQKSVLYYPEYQNTLLSCFFC